MVTADFYSETGEYLRASLADDDGADCGKATVPELNAEVFRIGISAVFGCAGRFFMCHSGGNIKSIWKKVQVG